MGWVEKVEASRACGTQCGAINAASLAGPPSRMKDDDTHMASFRGRCGPPRTMRIPVRQVQA